MTVVAIIIANGLVFHFRHMPLIDRHKDIHFATSGEFVRKRKWILMSGAISGVSWSSAIILGVLRGIPYPYVQLLAVYLTAVAMAVTTALLLRNRILPRHV
jgi:predicted branched-subunit amino acid permease